jgi:hypothetical protein
LCQTAFAAVLWSFGTIASDLTVSLQERTKNPGVRPGFFKAPHGGYTAANSWRLLIDRGNALNGQVDPHPPVQQIQQDVHTPLVKELRLINFPAVIVFICVPVRVFDVCETALIERSSILGAS